MIGDLFEMLEPRRLFAVDLSMTYSFSTPLPTIAGPTAQGTCTYTIRNTGTTDAPFPVIVAVYASTDKKLDLLADEQLSSDAIQSLKSGKSAQVSDEISYSIDPGRYYLIGAIVTFGGTYDPSVPTYGDVNVSNNFIVSNRPLLTSVPLQASTTITGTENSDKIGVIFSGDQVVFGVNGVLTATDQTAFAFATVNLLGGNDRFACNVDMSVPLIVNGGAGTDRISGGAGNDTLNGGDGSDRMFGGAGNDSIHGDGGNDRILGNDGIDQIFGDGGNDFIYVKGDGSIDQIDGGTGSNSAQYDASDVRVAIQIFIA